MATFTDTLGHSWDVVVTYHEHKRWKSELEVNIFAFLSDPQELATIDIEKQIDMIWLAVEGQNDGVDAREFAAGLSGDVLQDAIDALWGGIIDFFPEARKRDLLRAVLAKGKAVGDAMASKAIAQLEAVTTDEILNIGKSRLSSSAESSA